MELNEFIKQTIIQITDGIRDGHKYIIDNKFGEGVKDTHGKEVTFDVAVSTNEEETSGVSGKVSVVKIFTAGGKDESTTKASNVSRIQFKLYLFIKSGQ